MKAKKNPKISIERKRGLFFQIGLVITLMAVLVAFEWKSYEKTDYSLGQLQMDDLEDEMIPITRQEEKPPPPPPPPPEIIQIVEDEVEIEEELEIEDTELDEDEEGEDPDSHTTGPGEDWFKSNMKEVIGVPFSGGTDDNLDEVLQWMDGVEELVHLTAVTDCNATTCPGFCDVGNCYLHTNHELRADGGTPLGRTLFYAGEYLRRFVLLEGKACNSKADCSSPHYQCVEGHCRDPLYNCRQTVIVLFTDGGETMNKSKTDFFNPINQAKRMFVGLGCTLDSDCPPLEFCNVDLGMCAEGCSDDQGCPTGTVCSALRCQEPCVGSELCPSGFICDEGGHCMPEGGCIIAADCPLPETFCEDATKTCQPGCLADLDCKQSKKACVDGKCVEKPCPGNYWCAFGQVCTAGNCLW